MTAGEFIAWFAETSVAVTALILGVLAVRKPVARHLGSEAAYFLWLAPALRLLAPELKILPADPAPTIADGAANVILVEAVQGSAAANGADIAVAALWIWIIGAAMFIGVEAFRQAWFTRRLFARATPASPEIAAFASEIAAEISVKQPPRLITAAGVTGPLVAGLFRPVIVLPSDFERAWSPIERRLALAHELAHVRRGDLAATLAALLFRAAQWPNPIVHFAFRAFRADQEAACDAMVITRHSATPEIAYAYGAALVKSARRAFAAPAASLAMSNHLKERLMLMQTRVRPLTAKTRVVAAALIAGAVAATTSYSAAAERGASKEKPIAKKEERVSSINVISVDDGEALELEGVRNAKKIEIWTENGVRKVKIWDKDGKLISENVYGPNDDMPFETLAFVGADGERRGVSIGAEPGHPEWLGALDEEGAPGERKVMIMKHGDEIVGDGDLDCEPMEIEAESADVDGERRVTKNVICIKGAGRKDPAARAEALKKAIEHMETSAKREAEHREKMLAKLRAELAAAEKEAKKK